jgi:hypothetical protein
VRSDNLTAAVQTIGREKIFQTRYAGLLQHCGMRGSAIEEFMQDLVARKNSVREAKVETRTYAERLEVWYGQKKMEETPRLPGRGGHRIEYRHIIDWLMRKPGAFAAYRYRDDLFPGTCFSMAYDQLRREQPLRAAKEYLGILHCAAQEGEARTRAALETMLAAGVAVSATAVRARVAAGATRPEVALGVVTPVNLAVYDVLLERTAQPQSTEQPPS